MIKEQVCVATPRREVASLGQNIEANNDSLSHYHS